MKSCKLYRVTRGLFTGAVQLAKEDKGLEQVYAKKESLLLDTNNVIGKTSNTSVQNYIEVDNKVCTQCYTKTGRI